MMIIAHTIGQIPNDILHQSNCLILYKNAGITAQKLATLITPKKAYTVKKALSDLKDYEYYFISIEDELWHNSTENRDVEIIKKYLKGKIKGELLEIKTDREKKKGEDGRKKNAKTRKIKEAIRQGRDYLWIAEEYDTTSGYLRKIASEMRKNKEPILDRRRKEWRSRNT